MSFFMKSKKILCTHKISSAVQICAIRKGHWLPDYLPGPYPKTKEEREKAAKKYNLLPEEYEPYSGPEQGFSDYPKLFRHSVDSKDPWYPWDFPELRRNFNEPVHMDLLQMLPELTSTAPGQTLKDHLKDSLIFIKYMTGASILIYFLLKIVHVFPRSEKQYPFSGTVHYTFELSKEKMKKIRDPACDEN